MDKIGTYQILELIHGGPRRLYRVRSADGRLLALKTIETAGVTSEIRERFTREAAICKDLNHPNLVRVYDSGEADGFLYQAMDLLQGSDLSKVLAERRPLSWEQKLSMMEQICEGLEYAHARRLIHRDIKPANLFLENSERVKILDFGMARVESSDLTKAGMAVGTLTYMAPEQIRGETCTPASDLFAAGIVFYELATGKHPFAFGETDIAKILSAVVFQPPPPLKDSAPDAPDGLDLVLNKALEKDPAKRLQSAADFQQALWLCKVALKAHGAGAARPKPAIGAEGAAKPSPAPMRHETADTAGYAKTVVAPRPLRPPAEAPPRPDPSPPAPAAAAAPAPKPTPKLDLTFCPSCTYGNPKGARVCVRCGLPLEGPRLVAAEQEGPRLRWPIIAVVAAGIVLLIVLILAVISK